VVVVIIEPALSDSHRSSQEMRVDRLGHCRWIVRHAVVRMHTHRVKHEAWILAGDGESSLGGQQGFPYTDNSADAGEPGPRYHLLDVGIERGIRKVGVAIDEQRHRRLLGSSS
jgi:hypothetical protein